MYLRIPSSCKQTTRGGFDRQVNYEDPALKAGGPRLKEVRIIEYAIIQQLLWFAVGWFAWQQLKADLKMIVTALRRVKVVVV